MQLFNTERDDEADRPLRELLLELQDNFAEFKSVHAFLAKALTTVLDPDTPPTKAVVLGAKNCERMLTDRLEELDQDVALIVKRYRQEHQVEHGGAPRPGNEMRK